MLTVDFGLYFLEKSGISSKYITQNETLMTILRVVHGLSDAITLENIIARNGLLGWYQDTAIFLYSNFIHYILTLVLTDPLIIPFFFWICRKNPDGYVHRLSKLVVFALLLSLSHNFLAMNKYTPITDLRIFFGMKSS
jgi:hypothetical protein